MAAETHGRLKGMRIALTREAADNHALASLLAGHGARVLLHPLVRTSLIAPAQVPLAARRYDWLALSSRRAVAWVDWLAGTATFGRVACVGTATAQYVRAVLGTDPLVPTVQTAEGLARAMIEAGLTAGASVLFPRGNLARDTLPVVLRQAGASVDDPIVYKTLPEPAEPLVQAIARGEVDVIVLASPSAVQFALDAGAELARVRCFSIGPSTSDALRRNGIPVAGQAASPNDLAMLECISAAP